MTRSRSVVLVIGALAALPALHHAAAQRVHYHVVDRVNLGKARADYIIIDADGRRLYGLGDNVINVDDDKIVSIPVRIRVASRADQNCFDASSKLVFNPNRADSTMSVIHEDSPDQYSVSAKVTTGGGARTCAVDDKTHKVFVFYYEGTTRENAQLVMAVLAP
jgi:hypothetical protein